MKTTPFVAAKRSASRYLALDETRRSLRLGLWCEKPTALPEVFCDTVSVEYPPMLQERGKGDTPGSPIWAQQPTTVVRDETTPSAASGRGHRSNNRNANIAIGPERIEQNRIIAAQHSHVDCRLTKLQVA